MLVEARSSSSLLEEEHCSTTAFLRHVWRHSNTLGVMQGPKRRLTRSRCIRY